MFFAFISSAVVADCNLQDQFRDFSFRIIDEFHVILNNIYHVIIEFRIFGGAVADTLAGDNAVVLWIFGNFIQNAVSKILFDNPFGNGLFIIYAKRTIFGYICDIILNRSEQSAQIQILASAGRCKHDSMLFQYTDLVENNWIYIMCTILK